MKRLIQQRTKRDDLVDAEIVLGTFEGLNGFVSGFIELVCDGHCADYYVVSHWDIEGEPNLDQRWVFHKE